MKLRHYFHVAVILAAATVLPVAAQAQTPPATPAATPAAGAKPVAADMTEGEVRKVDTENKKLTIKHGEIKNLDMPPMTMVFQVSDPAFLAKLKPGDKVRFKANNVAGKLTVTEIQPSN